MAVTVAFDKMNEYRFARAKVELQLGSRAWVFLYHAVGIGGLRWKSFHKPLVSLTPVGMRQLPEVRVSHNNPVIIRGWRVKCPLQLLDPSLCRVVRHVYLPRAFVFDRLL